MLGFEVKSRWPADRPNYAHFKSAGGATFAVMEAEGRGARFNFTVDDPDSLWAELKDRVAVIQLASHSGRRRDRGACARVLGQPGRQRDRGRDAPGHGRTRFPVVPARLRRHGRRDRRRRHGLRRSATRSSASSLHANPTVHDGSWAELIALTQEMQVASNPDSLDVAAAGVAPLAGIVALAAVRRACASPKDKRS